MGASQRFEACALIHGAKTLHLQRRRRNILHLFFVRIFIVQWVPSGGQIIECRMWRSFLWRVAS